MRENDLCFVNDSLWQYDICAKIWQLSVEVWHVWKPCC